MKGRTDLARALEHIDGRGYKAYKEIRGEYDFGGFTLVIDHVQGDPFAAPSRVRALVPAATTLFEEAHCRPGSRAVGLAHLIARTFARQAGRVAERRGSGKSGEIRMEAPGQEVLEQTAVRIEADGSLEARFTVGLPARGRRVLGRQAVELLCEDVPELVDRALVASAYETAEIVRHVETNEDADALRGALRAKGLVGFVADGAILPRRSGVDPRPLEGDEVVPFESPESLRVTIEVPNAGAVTGMGVPEGVTLIVGGGYHGKSTLLRALELGVYNHEPGDGRERVVADADAVKVRAEDGRSVAGVDISPFIDGLPNGDDTRRFTTANASGSTSQAAAIAEALESGARVLLVDEDTAATNFMIRDRRMQVLVPKEGEPITPFVDRIRQLHRERRVSSILVIGGSGDYLDVADTVVAMRAYRPEEVTERAREVAAAHPTGRESEVVGPLPDSPRRIPDPGSVDPSRGRRDVSVKVRGMDRLQFGTEDLDLSAVEQLVAWAQVRAIGEALVLARERFMDVRADLPEVIERVMAAIEEEGLDVLDRRRPGDLAAFRRHELAAALNRLRGLRVG